MKSSEELDRAISLLRERSPGAFEARIAELVRGGLPSQSMGSGIRSTWSGPDVDEHGNCRDAEDQWFEQRRSLHAMLIARILEDATQLQAIEREVLLTRLPFAVPDPVAVKCANAPCDNALENGLRSGECQRCRKARSRTGCAWQPTMHVNPKTGEMVG